MAGYQITDLCRTRATEVITPGGICIDATMGNGHDTLFLCRSVGETGRVIAFDIQEEALAATRARLKKALPYVNYELHCLSHERMDEMALPESVDCIMFNLGYLPGGDHRIATRAESTIHALTKAMNLLKKGGMISLCIYSGGDSGYEERDAVLAWLKETDPKHYLVLKTTYENRQNDPPIPVQIIRLA